MEVTKWLFNANIRGWINYYGRYYKSALYPTLRHPTYADAVLDRLVHNAHRIDLSGESLRRTRKPSRKA
jgi:hypothetical protein